MAAHRPCGCTVFLCAICVLSLSSRCLVGACDGVQRGCLSERVRAPRWCLPTSICGVGAAAHGRLAQRSRDWCSVIGAALLAPSQSRALICGKAALICAQVLLHKCCVHPAPYKHPAPPVPDYACACSLRTPCTRTGDLTPLVRGSVAPLQPVRVGFYMRLYVWLLPAFIRVTFTYAMRLYVWLFCRMYSCHRNVFLSFFTCGVACVCAYGVHMRVHVWRCIWSTRMVLHTRVSTRLPRACGACTDMRSCVHPRACTHVCTCVCMSVRVCACVHARGTKSSACVRKQLQALCPTPHTQPPTRDMQTPDAKTANAFCQLQASMTRHLIDDLLGNDFDQRSLADGAAEVIIPSLNPKP